MAWIAAIVAGAASAWQSHNKNRKARRQNELQQRFAADTAARNTHFNDAITGRYGGGGTGFQRDMYKIAQGQDLSPWLLNQPLNQINRGADTNMANLTAQLGRSNMSGGLANAYALSNQMGRQNSIANLFQNYGQNREQQRRSDLDWLTGGQGRQLDREIGLRQGTLDRYQQTGDPWSAGALAGLGTYASAREQEKGRAPTSPTPWAQPQQSGVQIGGNGNANQWFQWGQPQPRYNWGR